MADRVAVFNAGRIAQVGTPQEIYDRPRTRFVADFVGSANVLPPALAARFGARGLGEPPPRGDPPRRPRRAPSPAPSPPPATSAPAPASPSTSTAPRSRSSPRPARAVPEPGARVGLAWAPEALNPLEDAP